MDPKPDNPQANPQRNAAPSIDLKLSRQGAGRQSWFAVFKSNLKDFLTERPVKIPRGSEPSPFESANFGSSMSENFKEFWRPIPRSARRVNSDLLVADKSWLSTFWGNIRDTIAPRKLPPLEVTSEPVDVPEIWTKNKQFTKVQALSLAIHVAVIVLIILPLLPGFISPPTQANSTHPIEISEFLPMLKIGKKKAGGGGGRPDKAPPTRGQLPRFSMNPITPPVVKPIENPKLVAQATLMVPPTIHMPTPDLPNTGDPTSALVNDSMGNGSGSGMGSGNGSGLGSGSEYGVGGGYPNAGENGYSRPDCVYCPEPQYSDAGFKLKIQGEVVLDVIIGTDGRVIQAKVVKGMGYGLDEEAVKSATQVWRFKPAVGPNGQPAAVRMLIDVDFRLY